MCGEVKPAGDFSAYKYVTNQGKLSARLDPDCKVCIAAKRKEEAERVKENSLQRKRRRENPELMQAWRARRKAEPKPLVTEKMCTKCKEVKPAAKFYKRLTNADGQNSQCRACVLAVSSAYYRTIEPHRAAAWRQAYHLKRSYGMTLEEYEWLASSQDNKCLVCDKSGLLLDVDHCHATGRIRGLLCHYCNVALGLLRDDARIITGLLQYVQRRCGPE